MLTEVERKQCEANAARALSPNLNEAVEKRIARKSTEDGQPK